MTAEPVALSDAVEPADQLSAGWLAAVTARVDSGWRPGEWDPTMLKFVGDPDNPATWVFHCAVTGCAGFAQGVGCFCMSCGPRRNRVGRPKDFIENYAAYAPTRRYDDPDLARSFSLADLAVGLRTEVLFGLQVLDRDRVLVPERVRKLLARLPAATESLLEVTEDVIAGLPAGEKGLVRSLRAVLLADRVQFTGVDVTLGDVWDCRLLGLTAGSHRQYVARSGQLDFRSIHQTWLRELTKEYLRVLRPTVQQARHTLRAVSVASDALLGRPNGNEPGLLSMADMTAVIDHLQTVTKPEGGLLSANHRHQLFSRFRQMLTFLRQAGLIDHVPGSFDATGGRLALSRPTKRETEAEDLLGRSLPEHVIAQLDAHLDRLGRHSNFAQLGWSAEDVRRMYQTVYQLIRDTGRRPEEVTTLKVGCLTYIDDKPTLIYDNHKAGRLGRRLPIAESTAMVIKDWQQHLAGLPTDKLGPGWMFPSPGQRGRMGHGGGHLTASVFGGRVFRLWVDTLPALLDEGLDANGLNIAYPRDGITLYAFRHSYAQRHADAGTPVDVLRQLMDHVSVETTLGYYKVTLKRRREAVATVSDLMVDRHGRRIGAVGDLDYAVGTVAVPYGNCAEPSNIKAGGGHCPIRFQCAGCAFYRPDPSYLPAIETHVAELRINKEQALAADAANWVITNLTDQIDAFTGVTGAMHTVLDGLPEENLRSVEQASKEIRRIRQADTAMQRANQ